MDRVDLAGAGDVGGHDMDLFASQSFVDLGRPNRRTTLGRQEQLGEHQQPAHTTIIP